MKTFAIKQLTYNIKNKGGRNNYGQITAPRRRSLTKRAYRFLDVKRSIPGTGLILNHFLYDPYRSAHISLILFENGILTYVLAANIPTTQIKLYNMQEPPKRGERGWSNFLRTLPNGTVIFNISATFARAAGASAVLLSKKNKRGTLA